MRFSSSPGKGELVPHSENPHETHKKSPWKPALYQLSEVNWGMCWLAWWNQSFPMGPPKTHWLARKLCGRGHPLRQGLLSWHQFEVLAELDITASHLYHVPTQRHLAGIWHRPHSAKVMRAGGGVAVTHSRGTAEWCHPKHKQSSFTNQENYLSHSYLSLRQY